MFDSFSHEADQHSGSLNFSNYSGKRPQKKKNMSWLKYNVAGYYCLEKKKSNGKKSILKYTSKKFL